MCKYFIYVLKLLSISLILEREDLATKTVLFLSCEDIQNYYCNWHIA